MTSRRAVTIRDRDFLRSHLTPERITAITFDRLISDMAEGRGFVVLTTSRRDRSSQKNRHLLKNFRGSVLRNGREVSQNYDFHRVFAEWVEKDRTTKKEKLFGGECLFLTDINREGARNLAEKLFSKPYFQAGLLWGQLNGQVFSFTSDGGETLLAENAGKDDIVDCWATMQFDPSDEKGVVVHETISIERLPGCWSGAIGNLVELSRACQEASPFQRMRALELASLRERVESDGSRDEGE